MDLIFIPITIVVLFELTKHARARDAAGFLATAALVGCGYIWAAVVVAFNKAKILLSAMFVELRGFIVYMWTTTYNSVLAGHKLRTRRWSVFTKASKRTQRVLKILDIDTLGGDELELVERSQYTRCSILISRRARMGLKYPKHSKANERVAADWILKHLPEDMTVGVRHKVLPLAIKLTFVRSQHEEEANWHFEQLKGLVDFDAK